MPSDSAELRVRVILVTTRAALRHVPDDGAQRRAIVQRGRALMDALALDLGDQGVLDGQLEDAYAELETLERG